MSQRHEDLVAWQRADDLCIAMYRLTRSRFPDFEKYELSKQVRRAAYSVPANIVEGYASDAPKVRLRYLRIAVGSLAETGYGIHVARRLGYLTEKETTTLRTQISKVAAPLHGLIAHVKREVASRSNR